MRIFQLEVKTEKRDDGPQDKEVIICIVCTSDSNDGSTMCLVAVKLNEGYAYYRATHVVQSAVLLQEVVGRPSVRPSVCNVEVPWP